MAAHRVFHELSYKTETDAVLLCDTVTEYHHICLKNQKILCIMRAFPF